VQSPVVRHERSLIVVSATDSYWLPRQTVAAVHASPESAVEYVSAPQALHTRLALALPAVVWPTPAGQVTHKAQLVRPAVAVNWPLAHAAHVRSLAVVSTAVSYCPAGHSGVRSAHTAASLAVEKVEPRTQSAHWRLSVALGVLLWPWPMGQVAWAAHSLRPAVVVNVSAPHAAHVRSLESVAAAFVYVPAAQGDETALHATVLAPVEYVVPTTQAAHWRSALAVPAADWPWPTGQVAQALHVPRPALAVNVPEAHAVHLRSTDAEGAISWYSPETQPAVIVAHAAPSSAALKVVPLLQATQVRSTVALPATFWPWPAGQVAQAAQEDSPALAVNVPEAHAVHVRSLEVVSTAVSYSPAGHSAVRAAQANAPPAAP